MKTYGLLLGWVCTLLTCSFLTQPCSAQTPNGLYFRIQLLHTAPDAYVREHYQPIEKRSETTFLGVFETYRDARKALEELNYHGFSATEVVAFFNRQSISLQDAMVLSNNQIDYENEFTLGGTHITTQELNRLLFEHAGEVNLDYKVHLGLYLEPTSLPLEGEPVSVEMRETDMGFYTYTIGNFATKEEALAFRKKLINRGVQEAYIVPYFNGKRVSTDLAHLFGTLYDQNTAYWGD